MCNIQQFIKKYNNFIQNKRNKITLSCDCRDKNECKLNGNCRTENVIYKYTSLTKSNVKNVYLGVPEREFKKSWYYNHQNSFQNKNYKNSTIFSSYLWSIKSTSEEKNVNLNCEVMRQAVLYSNISKRCLLCLHEKLANCITSTPRRVTEEKV